MGKPATRNRPWGIPPGSRLETARIQEKLSLMAFPCPHGQGGTLQLRETEKGGGPLRGHHEALERDIMRPFKGIS